MRALLLYNPIAGAGLGRELAEGLRGALVDAGHAADLIESRRDGDGPWLDDALAGVDVLVVVGGDGAMRLACGAAMRAHTPVYHYPTGTENLFAREFGSDRAHGTLLAALARPAFVDVDVGEANGERFLLMASIGFDADVVDDLARHRRGAIRPASYVAPVARTLFRWTPPTLTVMADDVPIVENEPGFLVVANARQYGWRFNPAARASMIDGLLDVVFFPTRSRMALIGWARRCKRGAHLGDPRLVYRNARSVAWTSTVPRQYQLDGDRPAGRAGVDGARGASGRADNVRVALVPGALSVLLARPLSESPQSRPRG